jgi:hypothetical protein
VQIEAEHVTEERDDSAEALFNLQVYADRAGIDK